MRPKVYETALAIFVLPVKTNQHHSLQLLSLRV